jgi:hypothetical protein
MTDSDFLETVRSTVEYYSNSYGITPDKAFVLFAAAQALGLDEEDSFDGIMVGGPNDLGLDFGLVDKAGRRVIVAQGKYTATVTRDEIRAFAKVPVILDDPHELRRLEANENVREFGRSFRKYKREGYAIAPHFFSLSDLTSAMRKEFGEIVNGDFALIKRLWESRQSTTLAERPDKVELPLSDYLKLNDSAGSPKCYVIEILLKDLYELYKKYGAGLFDDNVRLHAGVKTVANKGMIKTLTDYGCAEAEYFIFYNNGLCILCDSIKMPKVEAGRPQKIVLTGPQIINGAQTTATIGTLDEDQISDKASILARVICPPKARPDAFREQVIRFTNTQTPVTTRDFRSNDERQKQLFDAMDRWKTPYFYERKVGLWDVLDASRKSRFRRAGRHGQGRECFRIINNETLAKCIRAWDGKPASAKNEKHQIFLLVSDGGIYEEVFPDNCHTPEMVEEYILAYELNDKLLAEKQNWGRSFREADKAKDEEKKARLERLRFLTFFNFFGLAALGYLYSRHCGNEDQRRAFKTAVMTEEGFQKAFDYIRSIFLTQITAAFRASDKEGKVFNMANWFKTDDNFDRIIKPAIDDEAETKLPTLLGGMQRSAQKP